MAKCDDSQRKKSEQAQAYQLRRVPVPIAPYIQSRQTGGSIRPTVVHPHPVCLQTFACGLKTTSRDDLALVPKPANKSTKRIPTTTLYPKPTAGSHKRIHPIVKSSAYSVREVAAFCRRLHGPASCRKEQLSIWHTRHECPNHHLHASC